MTNTTTTRRRDDRHGGPYDRGRADAYYGRGIWPHFFEGATGLSEPITRDQMTDEQVEDYLAGFNEETDRKDYGELDWN